MLPEALKDTYIEELERELDQMKEHLKDFLTEREIAEKYRTKLERRLQSLKMTPSGRVLHFSPTCVSILLQHKMCGCATPV